LGNFFRYDNETNERTELLIVMTPHVVRTEADVARTRQIESARMSWCLGDVKKIHGNAGLEYRGMDWTNDETTVVYPDGVEAESLPQPQPVEQSTPVQKEPAPLPITPQSGQMPLPNDGVTANRSTPAAPPPTGSPPPAGPPPVPLLVPQDNTNRLQPADATTPGAAP
jgi:hypothetical protein